MSLSYIPYTNIDLLERLDLQTLNNAFEKLYLNDLFYSEIDRIAPKIFINGATYQKGDCVWYNTEDPQEFILSSNVHWRLIKYQINEQDIETRYPMAAKYDLLRVVSGDTYPNTIEHGGELSRTDWNILSGQYLDAISCAYDIGDITKPVQIYQYLGDRSVLKIPITKKVKYSDQKYLLSAYYPESAAKAETKTFTDLSIYMDESATISVETSPGVVTWKVLSAGCTYPLKEMSLKMPVYTTDKFYDSNWKPLLDSPVDKQDIINYVLNKVEEHVNSDLSSRIYRDHTTAHGETLSTFQVDYLNSDFSNISDDICQMDIPNLTFEDNHNMNTGFDYVYETVIDGDRGYRLWKSGLLEHWGKLTLDEQDFTGVSGWSYGYKVNLNWTYNAPDGNMYKSKTYTYDLSNSNTTNSNVNATVNVYGESEYLLADDNRYSVVYTWCNSSQDGNQYYKKILGTEYADNTDANIINFTECNVYNVKNTSFTIPNIAYLLGTNVEDGYVHHLHPTLYYYTSGFSRHVIQNMYNKKEKIIVYDLNELQLGGSFDSTWKYTGSPIKPDFQLTKGGIVIVGSGGTNQYHIDGQKLGAETNISRSELNDCSSATAISVYYDAGGTARGCYLKYGEPKTKPLSQWTMANHADYVKCMFSDTWGQHFAWDGNRNTWIELNDYIYHYENNVNASSYSKAKIYVEGLYECGISKNIKGQRTFEFQILPIAALDCYMTLYSYSYAYQVEEIVPEVYISYLGSQIPESDYFVEAWNNKEVGTASVKATFITNNIDGFIGDSFEIYKADMADCEIQLEHESYEYQGGDQIKPKGTVSLNGVELVEGVDYQVQYTNATYVAEGWPIRFIGINNLSGYQDLSFAITKVDISNAASKPDEDNPMFIGWSSSGLSLTDSVIELSASTKTVQSVTTTTTKYEYGLLPMTSSGTSTVGIPKTFTLMVTHNGKKLTHGQDYVVEFPEDIQPQELEATKVTVYGIGNYCGNKTVEAVPMKEGQNYRIVI